MNHYTWTYVAGEGRNIPVGIYHSSSKGHLVIYVGKKITTIDFNVLNSKDYTFFIDGELCHIRLKRQGEEMYYSFEIDKKADTPMNRARRKTEGKFLRQLLLGLAAFVMVVMATTVYLNRQKKLDLNSASQWLAQKGVETVARVTVKPGEQAPNITYHFVAKNQGYSAKPTIQSQPLVLLKNGMPLETGDEFMVLYVPTNPSVSRIDFDRPTERQISVYQKRAMEKHLSLNPNEAPKIAECMIRIAYEMEGIPGLAKFYFQNIKPTENEAHNENSFFRLVRSIPFQNKVKENCW